MAGEITANSLLATKLNRPPVGPNHVYRQRLLERLDQHRNGPCTLVSLPAGYGRSVLVSSWLESHDIPGAMQMVALYGHDLMNEQQWWLDMLPRDRAELDPELLLMEAWIYHTRFHLSEMATERYNALRPSLGDTK